MQPRSDKAHWYFPKMPTILSTTVSWNTQISRLSRSPNPEKALHLFVKMRSHGPPIDEYTLPPILRSCTSSSSSRLALSLHALSLKLGFLHSSPFVSSSLLLLHLSLSPLPLSLRLFDDVPMRLRDPVLWTSMLSGLAHASLPLPALNLFSDMLAHSVSIDEAVVVTLLSCCAQLGCLRRGRALHAFSLRRLFRLSPTLGNALIDMYLKCTGGRGSFAYAEKVFDRMPQTDVISWTALILGHGLNGRADAAVGLFQDMVRGGLVRPNAVTFLGVLSACAHAGMVDKALEVFGMMRPYGVSPELKHYACVVDALGRAGQLARAERLVEDMPVEPDEAILGALLSGCRVHGDVEVGERVARRLMEMCPDKSGYYVSLANLYSDAGRFGDAVRVRDFMRQMNVGKTVGVTSIELDASSSSSSSSRTCI